MCPLVSQDMFGTCSDADPVDQSGDIVISHTMVRFGYDRALRGFSRDNILRAQKNKLQNVVAGHETVVLSEYALGSYGRFDVGTEVN
jgi:hypothetical protein